jgi:putative nucleotidyltransferase with HDIG domain
MKKSILFVDDEPMVLEGLQRMLRAQRAEWDMHFADSGAKALALMETTPVDIIVSDMRMPGMNGAELLTQVMLRYPRTIRLILSGHADQDLIMKCVGSTHQYLAKPCDPESLKATVARAAALENSLQNETLKSLASRMDRLPSVPSLYVRMVETLQNPDADLAEVAELITQDLGMSAKILKLVNSAFFGLHRQVANPGEAVSYIGLDTLKSLVLAVGAFSQYEDSHLGSFNITGLWTHSMETAATAKAIAAHEDSEPKVREESFISGLLHDVGKLVLAANFPDQYREAIDLAQKEKSGIGLAEQTVFGADHARLGGYLLGLWGLPTPVVEAIASHHEPSRSLGRIFSPLTTVHVANVLSHPSSLPDGEAFLDQFDQDYLTALGLWDRIPTWSRVASATTDTQHAA